MSHADVPVGVNEQLQESPSPMQEPIAYLNGQYVPISQCVLRVFDMGVTQGVAVTDLLRTFHGKPYRIQDHLGRFYRSCKYAHLDPTVNLEESEAITHHLIKHNSTLAPGQELALIYYITAGENAVYAGSASVSEEPKPTYVQHTFPLPFHLWRRMFREGVRCATPSPRHWPPQSLSSKIKHRNRLHMWIGQKEIQATDPGAMPLYLDIHGNITETSGSNFVIYSGGKVISPRRPNILWGISLTVLTEILAEMGIPFVEDDIQTYDVVNADEAWVPTSPYCLGPVVQINGTAIGDGKPGPMWRKILDHWSEIVGKDIYAETAEAVE